MSEENKKDADLTANASRMAADSSESFENIPSVAVNTPDPAAGTAENNGVPTEKLDELEPARKQLTEDKAAFEKEKDAFNKKSAEMQEKEKTLNARQKKLDEQQEELGKQQEELREQQKELREQQEEFDEQQKEFKEKEKKVKKAEQLYITEVATLKQSKEIDLDQEIDLNRREKLEALEKELQTKKEEFYNSLKQKNVEFEAKAKKRDAELEKREQDLLQQEEEYKKAIEGQLRVETMKERLENRKSLLDSEVTARAETILQPEREEFKCALSAKDALISQLQDERGQLMRERDELRRIIDRTGEDPAKFLQELMTTLAEYDKRHEEGMQSASETPEIIRIKDKTISELQADKIELEKKIGELERSCGSEARLQIEINELKLTLDAKQNSIDELRYEIDSQKKELELRQNITEEERRNRIVDIQTPLPELIETVHDRGREKNENINEIDWLEKIYTNMEEYENPFRRRLLYAFHTSLKNAEFSPLTVLSGVSGTGKSKLPELYAAFGGLNFYSFPVQPNWDSPESLLGFFNSLSGKFEAQPLLKYLAQTQLWNKNYYPYDPADLEEAACHAEGLRDCVSIALLDEMNLAHVELYFADFLSKLEERRGKFGANVPRLGVRITNSESYPLPLGRNVLWVGTMNQDETTKTLSDKVLDRGTSIDFPRPMVFNRKTQAKGQPEYAPLLSIDTWTSWNPSLTPNKDFFSDGDQTREIEKYKEVVEEINSVMAIAGRAIGHRVWQSIEMYIANHPLVIARSSKGEDINKWKSAVKLAFEDQIVQKIMPKLRGVETSGVTRTHCLDEIKRILRQNSLDSLTKDFDDAMSDRNYGQFIWSSAKFYENDDCFSDVSGKPFTSSKAPEKDPPVIAAAPQASSWTAAGPGNDESEKNTPKRVQAQAAPKTQPSPATRSDLPDFLGDGCFTADEISSIVKGFGDKETLWKEFRAEPQIRIQIQIRLSAKLAKDHKLAIKLYEYLKGK